MSKRKMIILTGGGTLGSVVPLIALAEKIKAEYDFLWIGTKSGPEKEIVVEAGLEFTSIPAGKLRRYFSLKNLTDIFLILGGLIAASRLMIKYRPTLIVTAGGYVGVPVLMAGKIFGVKILVHQLDYVPGLANKIGARLADSVAVTWEKSLKDYSNKGIWTGSIVRHSHYQAGDFNRAEMAKSFGLSGNGKIILAVGGGTGAVGLNNLVLGIRHYLPADYQIIQVTGKGKQLTFKDTPKNYQQFEFLNQAQMADAYALADVVISRAGMAAILELSYLAKPAIIIPMPNSHQELNARLIKDNQAGVVLAQNKITSLDLANEVKNIINNNEVTEELVLGLRNLVKTDGQELVAIVKKLAN